jgi:signal transduction histidine kinase
MVNDIVLVIDFDSITKHVIRDTLRKEGYAVQNPHIDSLQDALTYLQKKEVDILIVNLTLPNIDSVELIKRARFVRPGIGIIVLSQSDSRDVIISAFQEGAHSILEKPFTPEDLTRIVDEVLEKGRLAKENIRLRTLLPLYELTDSLISELNAEKIFEQVVRLVFMETKANKVSLLLFDDSAENLLIKASIGTPKDQVGNNIERSDDSIIWSVIQTGKPVLLDGEATNSSGAANPCSVATLCVPLSIKGKAMGAIHCSKINARAGFSESDQELLSIIAGQATIAIENARLFNSVRGHQLKLETSLIKVLTAQEDERSRISAELHDGLAQWLVSASYSMQTGAEQMTSSKFEEARGELDRANDIVSQSVKELRRVILDLHPIALAELGLIGALRQSIDYFNKENGVRCDFNVIGCSANLSFINDVTIYRVIQEALNNVRKHASADHVSIVLEYNDDHVAVSIEDDGVGFDLKNIRGKNGTGVSLGLVTMKERAEMIGGDFEINTRPGDGTGIIMRLPVAAL